MCGSGGNPPPPSGGGSGPNNPSSPGATQPCPNPPCACGVTRWIDAQAYCGDRVRLEGTLAGGCPPVESATIEILKADGSVIETLTAPIRENHFTATWIAKAQTANWRNDRHRFRFTAAGLTCTSTNEFRFRQRPTTNWVLIDVNHPSNNGFLPVVELHDARLEANRVHYSLKLRTHGAAFPAARQANAKNRIETVWNNGFASRRFHRTNCLRGRTCDCRFDCCKAGYRLDVNFVTSGEHVPVEIVVSPPPPADPHRSGMARTGSHWGEPPFAEISEYAHEVGHVLGQYDEYADGATDPSGVQPAPPPVTNLMFANFVTTVFNRHYRWALKYLNDNAAGDPYEIIPP